MSIKVMTWVWDNGPADPTERLVLLALADHADDMGFCFPSMARIAVKACVTERGARGIIRRLEDGGWVQTKVGGGRGGKSQYTVLMGRNPEPQTGNGKPGIGSRETGKTRNVATRNPERGDTKPGTLVPPNRKEPSKNLKGDFSCEEERGPRVTAERARQIMAEVAAARAMQ